MTLELQHSNFPTITSSGPPTSLVTQNLGAQEEEGKNEEEGKKSDFRCEIWDGLTEKSRFRMAAPQKCRAHPGVCLRTVQWVSWGFRTVSE